MRNLGVVQVDWSEVFAIQTPLLEIFVRGTVTYLALFLLLRLVVKRQVGQMGVTDLLVVVLIADAAQNAMADDYRSVSDGVFLVAVILFWAFAIDWLGYRVPLIERLVQPPAVPLVRDGQLLPQNMRKQLITEDELRSQLRHYGIDDLDQVKVAYIEGDGKISAVRSGGDVQRSLHREAH